MSVKGLLLSIFFFLVFLVVARDRANTYDSELADLTLPEFDEQSIDFVPTYDGTKTLPFTASAIIDVDGDGTR